MIEIKTEGRESGRDKDREVESDRDKDRGERECGRD